jgi:hypothetical protein
VHHGTARAQEGLGRCRSSPVVDQAALDFVSVDEVFEPDDSEESELFDELDPSDPSLELEDPFEVVAGVLFLA